MYISHYRISDFTAQNDGKVVLGQGARGQTGEPGNTDRIGQEILVQAGQQANGRRR